MSKNPDDFTLVAVTANEVQAMVYRKILRDRGIEARLLDANDRPVDDHINLHSALSDVKVVVPERDAELARELIKDHEDGKITKVFSRSGDHIFFRCPQCRKYLWFPAQQKGTDQLCPHCLKIVSVPE